MLIIKKLLKNIFKYLSYGLFKIIYGKIKGKLTHTEEVLETKNVNFENNLFYKIFIVKNSRLYTDRVNDTAIIHNNHIVDGPSFQLRESIDVNSNHNIVFLKGTPRIKKKIDGVLFSLLTGGGGNSNYWHWLFDVLPRLNILNQIKDTAGEVDYYLFPGLDCKFQKESLDIINIPKKKRLSSKNFRHIESKKIIITSHPYTLLNDPDLDSLQIPIWISGYLRKVFLKDVTLDNSSKKFPTKIFINRKDGTTKKWRYIINEKEVETSLEEKGFKSLTLTDYSFLEQVNIFHHAEKIVGLHGAGFANIVFCKPGTKILELRSNSAGDVVKNLAISNKLVYNDISLDPKTINYNNQAGDIEIDLKILHKSLS